MKCTNCGKNNAVVHYRYEVNGEATEAHLCADCARKLQPERELAAMSREMFGGMLDGDFFTSPFAGGGLLRSFFGRDPFEGFLPLSLFGAPRIEISFPEASGAEAATGTAGSTGVDPELSKRREINALREQMRAAAESEDYERAAQLRDKLREMEKNDSK